MKILLQIEIASQIYSMIFFVNVGSRLYSFLTKYKQKAVWFQKRPLYKPCIDLINKYFDNDYLVCGVFINLQKAFDTINHEILLVKLDFYGIRGLANSWLKSFFENRKQYVSLLGQSSSVKAIACDVPQGSALGPLLFLLHINDLQSVFSKSVIHHFADDTNLLFSAKKLGTIESVINHELKLLVHWLQSNKLSLNETKTELIIFRSAWKHLPHEPDIRLYKYKLKSHSNIKYLDVLIDEVLSQNKQIDNICTKLARANGILSKLRHFVPRKTCISKFLFILLSCPLWLFGLVLLNPT